jgi:hypothetical protein
MKQQNFDVDQQQIEIEEFVVQYLHVLEESFLELIEDEMMIVDYPNQRSDSLSRDYANHLLLRVFV